MVIDLDGGSCVRDSPRSWASAESSSECEPKLFEFGVWPFDAWPLSEFRGEFWKADGG
jgi:hypothetical protein